MLTAFSLLASDRRTKRGPQDPATQSGDFRSVGRRQDRTRIDTIARRPPLQHLEALPPTGFTISCFPHKIRAASAGWTRAVAIFED